MKKNILCPLLALLVALLLPMSASAEIFTGSEDWHVDFDGKSMTSNFSTAQLDDSVREIQPGDHVTMWVRLNNNDADANYWYMNNEVLQTLEESQSVANGGAYTYRLSYLDNDARETVLYDSDSVGGEKSQVAGVGLHEATDSLEEYFYLDTLDAGDTGIIQLIVALDGETQGNAYQDTLAKLQMSFATEKALTKNPPTTPGTPPSTDESNPPTTPTRPTTHVPTGDHTNLPLWIVLMVASGGATLFLIIWSVRSRKKEGEHE